MACLTYYRNFIDHIVKGPLSRKSSVNKFGAIEVCVVVRGIPIPENTVLLKRHNLQLFEARKQASWEIKSSSTLHERFLTTNV